MMEGSTTVEGHGGVLAAETLKRHGVEVVFTLSGGHLFPLYDGCVKAGIRIVDVRHEQTAVFAAEAWAKLTRKPGVAALTAGPGVTNGISALTTSHFTGSPVLVLGGRAPESRWGQGSLQELDHVPLVKTVTKHAATCRVTAEIPRLLQRAFDAVRTPHRGPAFLDFPLDVLFSSAKAQIVAKDDADLPGVSPDGRGLDRVRALLRDARRPLLLAGSDVYWGGAEVALAELAEAARLPVFMNGLGRGCLPQDHPRAFSRARSYALKKADLVLVAGTPLDFRLGFGRFDQARVVHLCDSAGGRARHAELEAWVEGDLEAVFRGLKSGPHAETESWNQELRGEEERRREGERETLESPSRPIHPARIYGELARRLPRDAVVIGDGGDFVSYAGKYVDTYTPGSFLEPGPFGCLGTGPGYALGAALAFPGRRVVLLLGDGAAGFSLAELDTLARFRIPVTIVVGNNGCWGLEKHPMQQFFGYHVAAELAPNTRYDEVARALGGWGERVDDPDEIGPALERAFKVKGPALVNVMTDPENAYPRSSLLA